MNILFFTPHIALWAHTVPESYLAKALMKAGYSIKHLTCGAVQTYCAAMSAFGLSPSSTPDKSKYVCSLCKTGSQNLSLIYNFKIDKLRKYLFDEDIYECKKKAQQAFINRTTEVEFLGVNVGKIALYEFTLLHKKMSTVFTDIQWNDYRIFLENALITLKGFSRYIENFDIQVIATYSPQYSNINSCMQYALNRRIRVLFMEAGNNISHRLGTMRIWDWGIHKLVNPALKYWEISKKNPVSKESAKAVSEHFRQLLKGEHFAVFSTPYSGQISIREKWGIHSNQKILLMTLSSYDEAYAAFLIDAFPENKTFSNVYKTQFEWLKATIQWVSKRKDLFLVIRVHPRDFPNKREQICSEQSVILQSLLENVPDNIYVNWPSEGTALYEIFEDTDVILTGWSVTGMEGLALGIPVVTYDKKLPSYPADIMWTGTSEVEYFQNIDYALKQGWSINNVINGFRWLGYNFVESTVIVSNNFGRYELNEISHFHKILRKIKNRFPRIGQVFDLINWHGAREAEKIISHILKNNYDSISAVKSQYRQEYDDEKIITLELVSIYRFLRNKKTYAVNKSGLLNNIKNYLENKKVL